MSEKQENTDKLGKNTYSDFSNYLDKKAELLRRVSDFREWCARKIGTNTTWYPIFKMETDVTQKEFNIVTNGSIRASNESVLNHLEKVVLKLEQATEKIDSEV